MASAFITGATGFIGSHLLRKIVDSGGYEKIYVLVRKDSLTENIKWVKEREEVVLVKGDLLEPDSFENTLSRCEHIYHTAGFVGTNRKYRDAVFKLNYQTTINLLNAIRKVKPQKVVYLASIYALGKGAGKAPADERIEYNLQELAEKVPYLKAKRIADLEAFRCAEDGFPLVFGFPCYCLGPGDVYLSSSRIVLASIKGITRFYVDGGINVVDVRDAANGLYLCMEKGRNGEKYILGGYNLTFRELLTELSRFTGTYPYFRLPSSILIFTGFLGELLLGKKSLMDAGAARIMCEYWFYTSEKAKRELGYAVRPLEETLKDSVEWLKAERVYYGRRKL